MEYSKHISIDPNIRFGKPCITGTRITVYDILNMLANGLSIEDIQEDFPEISRQQVLACLAYAANREQNIKVAS